MPKSGLSGVHGLWPPWVSSPFTHGCQVVLAPGGFVVVLTPVEFLQNSQGTGTAMAVVLWVDTLGASPMDDSMDTIHSYLLRNLKEANRLRWAQAMGADPLTPQPPAIGPAPLGQGPQPTPPPPQSRDPNPFPASLDGCLIEIDIKRPDADSGANGKLTGNMIISHGSDPKINLVLDHTQVATIKERLLQKSWGGGKGTMTQGKDTLQFVPPPPVPPEDVAPSVQWPSPPA